jgi:hypothetical protein
MPTTAPIYGSTSPHAQRCAPLHRLPRPSASRASLSMNTEGTFFPRAVHVAHIHQRELRVHPVRGPSDRHDCVDLR